MIFGVKFTGTHRSYPLPTPPVRRKRALGRPERRPASLRGAEARRGRLHTQDGILGHSLYTAFASFGAEGAWRPGRTPARFSSSDFSSKEKCKCFKVRLRRITRSRLPAYSGSQTHLYSLPDCALQYSGL